MKVTHLLVLMKNIVFENQYSINLRKMKKASPVANPFVNHSLVFQLGMHFGQHKPQQYCINVGTLLVTSQFKETDSITCSVSNIKKYLLI